jgi:hypothetical protein
MMPTLLMGTRAEEVLEVPLGKMFRRANVGDSSFWTAVPRAEQDEFDAVWDTDQAERDKWSARSRALFACIEKANCEALPAASETPDQTVADQVAETLAEKLALDEQVASIWWATRPRQTAPLQGTPWNSYADVDKNQWRYRIATMRACLDGARYELKWL